MGRAAIVTDTTHYLPRDLVARYDLHEVSLYVNWQGGQEREADILDLGPFYDQLYAQNGLPTTSQPSIGDFFDVYRPLLAEDRDIVSIHLAAGISGTYQSAVQAKERLEAQGEGGERITVIDSGTACGGLGFVLLAAASAASDSHAAIQRAHAAREELKMWFCLDTLEFLKRGGRIGAAQAWLGSTLKIKPILTVESEITPVERVRTTSKAFERMVEYLQSRHQDGADGWAVQHIRASEQAARLVERGREIFGSEPLYVSEVGPVIGAHVGPGLVGVGGVSRALLS